MRRVFITSADVIHLFANQLQNEARSSNVFFDPDYNSELDYATKIYSYGRHYLLGKFIDRNTIIINDTGYSVTTAKHIRELDYATSHKKQFYTTQTDLSEVLSSVRYNIRKLQNARKPELYISPSLNLWTKLNEFIEYTRHKEMVKTIEYKEIKTLIESIKSDPKTSIDALNKFAKTKAKKEARIENAKRKKEVKEFRTYKRDYLTVGGMDFLRMSKDGSCVETSQRVTVTLKEARRVLRLIDLGKIIGDRINDNFVVTAMNGSLKVGCHNIDRDEIETLRPHL